MVESRDVAVADRNAARRVGGKVLNKACTGGVLVLDEAMADGSAMRRCRGGVLFLDKWPTGSS